MTNLLISMLMDKMYNYLSSKYVIVFLLAFCINSLGCENFSNRKLCMKLLDKQSYPYTIEGGYIYGSDSFYLLLQQLVEKSLPNFTVKDYDSLHMSELIIDVYVSKEREVKSLNVHSMNSTTEIPAIFNEYINTVRSMIDTLPFRSTHKFSTDLLTYEPIDDTIQLYILNYSYFNSDEFD